MNFFLFLLLILVPTLAIWAGLPVLLASFTTGEMAVGAAFLVGVVYASSVYLLASRRGEEEPEGRSMELRGGDHFR